MRTLRALLVGLLAMAVVVGAAGVATARTHLIDVRRDVRLTGHGYGHGIGMSQYGAEGAAREGRTWREIVSFYYPGTTIGRGGGTLRVLITADTTADVKVSPAPNLHIRDLGARRAWELPARAGISRWRINPNRWVQRYEDGRWRRWRQMDGPSSEFYRPGGATVDLWVPGSGGEVTKAYRGRLRATHDDTVNVLQLEDYLRGVVPREMPASWSSEALKSQAVAARTYAIRLRAENPRRYYQMCDTTSCQVYEGADAEDARSDAAIQATAHRVLRYDGAPALTMFSSSTGGWSADGGLPYLRARRDTWDGWNGNPMHTWHTTISAASIESRYPAIGRLIGLDIVKRSGDGRWGGRVEQVVLDGTSGDVTVSGTDLRFSFGLRSHWFRPTSTAIGTKWRKLGRESSAVGGTKRPEYATRGGAAQVFDRGRIYWSKETGAHEVHGAVLKRYLHLGGAKGRLRFPTTDEHAVRGGRASDFQGGRLVWHRASKRVTVRYF
ncbi:MAG TPA: SpoIID/LytB domain-containing protein [Nocardioidaceae bacterium]|nr:SpoIID/LytB domain-containing protein [Nocardioidaceae bacterium]